jgi:hypothetical protein
MLVVSVAWVRLQKTKRSEGASSTWGANTSRDTYWGYKFR